MQAAIDLPTAFSVMQIPKPPRTTDDFPIFCRFGWGGIESPEFRSALVAANRYVGNEVMAKRYEERRCWSSVNGNDLAVL